jgi:hypothetical protein
MDIFDKVRLALRDHLLKNKDRVIEDLNKMREESEGNDIYEYIDKLSEPILLTKEE